VNLATLPLAFSLGLASTLHCWGMCGGIVGAFGAALPSTAGAPRGLVKSSVLFNLGRIASYTLGGALAGGVGAALVSIPALPHAYLALQFTAGALLLLIGLQLGGWLPARFSLEQAALPLWRRLRDALHLFVPMDRPHKTLGAGLIWGFVPCGLVYSALAWSAGTADIAQGAMTMLAFGAGTMPGMVAAGIAAGRLRNTANRPDLRRLLALLFIGAGIAYAGYHLWSAFLAAPHHAHIA
jgi:hypothetical protein